MISSAATDFESGSDDQIVPNGPSIEAMAAHLAREEHRLNLLRTSIDLQVLDEDLQTLQQLKNAQNSAKELKEDIERHTKEKNRLEMERYKTFSSAMARINKWYVAFRYISHHFMYQKASVGRGICVCEDCEQT